VRPDQLLDIQAENGVIEIGSIWFGLTLRRTRSATEALYLMLRYAMEISAIAGCSGGATRSIPPRGRQPAALVFASKASFTIT